MADNVVFVVQYTNEKSCFARTDSTHWRINNVTSENLADCDVVKLTSDDASFVYFGLSQASRKSRRSDGIFLNGIYASKLGIKNNAKVSVELLKNSPVCVKAWLEPVTVDDWEILEIHAQQIEGSMLDQIRVLWADQIFPLWVTGSVCIFLKTVAIEPAAQCAVLIPLTELIVEPKIARAPALDRARELPGGRHERSTKLSTFPKDEPAQVVKTTSERRQQPTELESSEPKENAKISLLQRLLQLTILRRLCEIFTYIFNILWRRVLPTLLGPFSLFKAVPKSLAGRTENLDLRESVLSRIKDFPQQFQLVLRVEAMQIKETSSLAKFDQVGFASLDYDGSVCDCRRHLERPCCCGKDDMDFRIFYVGLKKLPAQKDSLITDDDRPKAPENLAPDVAVVRLCVQSMSKFAMFFREENEHDVLRDVVCSLRLSAVLRIQLGIGISSRVYVKKLKKLPKPAASNIKKIVLRTLEELPQDIDSEDVIESFKNLLRDVCDDDNPSPIVPGSVFCIPLRRFLAVPENAIAENPEGSNILVSVEKIFDFEDMEKSDCYLLSPQDLPSISIEFISLPLAHPKIDEIDPKTPQESAEGLIPVEQTVISNCLRHAEAVFQSRPIPSKLAGEADQIHPGHILLTGPSGMGKTHLCRAFLRKLATSEQSQAYVRWINCSKFKGKKPESVKKLFQNVMDDLYWRQPAALLLDDIDHLVPSNASPDGESSPSAVNALQLAVIFKDFLHKWCGGSAGRASKVCIIATALSEQAIHPVLLPAKGCYLFSRHLEVNLPENNERLQLLKTVILSDLTYDPHHLSRIDLKAIARVTEGFATKDFVQVAKRAMVSAKNRSRNTALPSPPNTADFENALSGYVPVSLQNANLHKPKKFFWSDVGGLCAARKQLTEKLIWPTKYAYLYQSAGMQINSGMLLYGPPGCGKTLLAGVVANECKLNFISVKGPEILSKYIGASEAAVRELFNRAGAAAPCILFFDEFDSVAQKRGHDSTGVTDRVVNQILTHLDGVEPLSGVYVLAATSRPDLIDPAILRPGRLDTHIHCPLPDFEERCDILSCLLQKLSLADEVNVRAIAARCEHFTGADLRALVYDAQLQALHSHANAKKLHTGMEKENGETTLASTSSSLSFVDMDLDDQYSSNGFKSALQDLKEEVPESIQSADFVAAELTKTAANLASSIQYHNMQHPDSQADRYKLCYGLSPENVSSSSGASSPKTPVSKIIYFPHLYSKADDSSSLPGSVQQLVDNISVANRHYSATSSDGDVRSSFKENAIIVSSYHFETALETASPSVSSQERKRYMAICKKFSGTKDSENSSDMTMWDMRKQQRATLA